MDFDPMALAHPGVRGLQPYEPGKPLAELEREYGVRDALKLASNENPLGPSPRALAAIKNELPQLARYPDGNGFALKAALAARLGVRSEQLTLGNGSNELLELVTRSFAGPGHQVLFSEYAFLVYPLVTQLVGATPVVVPARDWGHDLAAMAAAVTAKTRLIFIANPNNPTGTWLKSDELEAFINALPAHVIVVLDEAYFEYVVESQYPDSIAWLARMPNLIVTRTFSKIYGLAGVRVGYSVSSPEIADLLNRARQPFNVNQLALVAAEAALGDEAHRDASVAMNLAGMQQLRDAFDSMGLAFIPSVGNFISIDMGCEAQPLYQALLRLGVILRPLANYGMPQHLRITIGSEQENQRCIDALREVLQT